MPFFFNSCALYDDAGSYRSPAARSSGCFVWLMRQPYIGPYRIPHAVAECTPLPMLSSRLRNLVE